MKRVFSWDPFEIGGEAVDGGVRSTLRWNDVVPVLVYYAAAACHVALTGEDEDLFFWLRWVV